MSDILKSPEIDKYLGQLETGWRINDEAKLEKEFRFSDYEAAMKFVQKVSELAQEENHHPDICIYYTKVKIVLWTHLVNGLSLRDFAMARMIDGLQKRPF